MPTIQTAIDELHRAFDFLNESFFDSELPTPAILIQNQGKRKDVLGWCTSTEVWSDKQEKIKLYEINITAEYLNRNYLEIMETMLHEMIHLYNALNGVQDTSRGGTYHNKKFKKEAENRGLHVIFTKQYGWNHTELTNESLEIIKQFKVDRAAFTISRAFYHSLGSKSSSMKWACPECNTIVRSTKEVHVICGDCNVPMIYEEPKSRNQESA